MAVKQSWTIVDFWMDDIREMGRLTLCKLKMKMETLFNSVLR